MKYIILLLMLTGLVRGNAQSANFYGQHNIIEAEGLVNMRLFGKMFNQVQHYKASGNSGLTSSNNFIDYGWRTSFYHYSKSNFGVGIEAGFDYRNISFDYQENRVITSQDNWGDDLVKFRHEMLGVRTLSVIPKFSFTSKGGLLPIGFSNEIGFGYTLSKIADRDYNYKVVQGHEYFNDSVARVIEDNYVNNDENYSGFTLLYAMKVRIPLSKKLLLSYGFRYTLNFRNFGSVHSSSSNKYIISNYYVDRAIGRDRLFNFISFNMGLAYAF